MDFWYTILVIFSSFLLVWLGLWLKNRFALLLKIRGACWKCGYFLHPARRLWLFFGRYSPQCDFVIEAGEKLLFVKLFSMPLRPRSLIIKEGGEYRLRSFAVFLNYGGSLRIPISGHARKMPSCEPITLENEKQKEFFKILLIHPAAVEVLYQPLRGGEVLVECGDTVNDMRIETLSHLLATLHRV